MITLKEVRPVGSLPNPIRGEGRIGSGFPPYSFCVFFRTCLSRGGRKILPRGSSRSVAKVICEGMSDKRESLLLTHEEKNPGRPPGVFMANYPSGLHLQELTTSSKKVETLPVTSHKGRRKH